MGSMGLNAGPPLPPNLQPQPPQQSIGALAGQQGAPTATPGGSASLQQAVVEKMMGVEQSLQDLAQLLPDAGPIVDKVISTMRQGLTPILQKGVQAPPPASSMGMMMAPVAPQ